MKPDKRTNYVDARGVPHGKWCAIIARNLAAWNREQERLGKTAQTENGNDKDNKED